MNESDITFEGQEPEAKPAAAGGMVANPYAQEATIAAPLSAMSMIELQAEIAERQSRRLMARKVPRNRAVSMDNVLRECTEPFLAERSSYSYPRGNETVTGPTIRLVEAVARQWGNIRTGTRVLSQEGGVSWVKAYAEDEETGFVDERVFPVKHWRDTKKGGYPLKDERDINELVSNMAARRKRSCIEAVIPRAVFKAALDQCEVTMHASAGTEKKNIDAMLAMFAPYGVTSEHIVEKIGRRLDDFVPANMVFLRKVYNSIKDGLAKPWEHFNMPRPEADDEPKGKGLSDYVAAAQAREAEAPGITLADIEAKIKAAVDRDALDLAESLIPALADEAQRLRASDLLALKRGALA